MIYTVNDDKINSLTLQQLISFMFKDYQDIIEGYNNGMIKLLEEEGILGSINNFKEKLIFANFSIIKGGLSLDDEQKFINEIRGSYMKFKSFAESQENMNKATTKRNEIKQNEFNEKNREENIINDLISSMDSIF